MLGVAVDSEATVKDAVTVTLPLNEPMALTTTPTWPELPALITSGVVEEVAVDGLMAMANAPLPAMMVAEV
jgi:hypothetical protein